MYLIREVFKCKPGKAKELVKKFKEASKFMEGDDMKNLKIMTDIAATYWTVVMQFELEDLGVFAKEVRGGTSQPEMENIMKGYMDLLDGGYREIFLIEN
jgi:hypothetical protein